MAAIDKPQHNAAAKLATVEILRLMISVGMSRQAQRRWQVSGGRQILKGFGTLPDIPDLGGFRQFFRFRP